MYGKGSFTLSHCWQLGASQVGEKVVESEQIYPMIELGMTIMSEFETHPFRSEVKLSNSNTKQKNSSANLIKIIRIRIRFGLASEEG